MDQHLQKTLEALINAGQLRDARILCKKYCTANRRDVAAWSMLGIINIRLGTIREAARCFRHIIDLVPQHAGAHYNLAKLLAGEGKYEQAIRHYQQAVNAQPDFAEAFYNLANLLKEQGDLEGASINYRQALHLRPRYIKAHCNFLSLLSYNVMGDPQSILEAHRAWDRIHGGAAKAATFGHTRHGDPDKRLRIGYVSPDFRKHAVSYFFEPLLEAHDRSKVEVYCYAEVPQPDDVTARLQLQADHWRSTVGLCDEDAARRIHADGIDILIDLAGHTAGNRLGIFTYKPAPIQATYLGYCTTTGLTAMDYWISDCYLNPEDTPELATENIYRLRRCWLCYRPPGAAPEPADRPPDVPLTFGSLNNLVKLTPEVIALWSRILQAVPGSRLLLKTWQLAHRPERTRISHAFAGHGISAERLILEGASAHYLETYQRIDIALDPFPRTGGATTADALWMGVPVISLAGDRYIERQGVSLLTAVGLPELIAYSREQYLAKAVALAQEPQRRSSIHHTLRPRMARSPLCDAASLAQDLESAYREMWQHYLGVE